MSIASVAEIAVPEEVLAEVRRKNAEVEFAAFRETVLDHFPDAQSIHLRLLADPDEEDRCWVLFEVSISRAVTPSEYSQMIKKFYSDLPRRRPHVVWPICSLHLEFACE